MSQIILDTAYRDFDTQALMVVRLPFQLSQTFYRILEEAVIQAAIELIVTP